MEDKVDPNPEQDRNKQYLIETIDQISQKMGQVYDAIFNTSTYPLAEHGMPDPLSVLQRQTLSAFDDILYKLNMQRLSDTRLSALQTAEDAAAEMDRLSKARQGIGTGLRSQ